MSCNHCYWESVLFCFHCNINGISAHNTELAKPIGDQQANMSSSDFAEDANKIDSPDALQIPNRSDYYNKRLDMKQEADEDREDMIDSELGIWMKNNSMRIRRYSEIQDSVRKRYEKEYVELIFVELFRVD